MKAFVPYRIKRLLLLGLVLVSISSQAITLYKWTDPNGTPHFSDVAPTNGVNLKNVQVIEMRTDGRVADAGKMAGATSAPTSTSSAPTATGAAAAVSPDQARVKELEAERTQERCKSLQNNLQNLNAGGRVYEMDAKGERKYLDDREMELRKQRVAEAVSQYCK